MNNIDILVTANIMDRNYADLLFIYIKICKYVVSNHKSRFSLTKSQLIYFIYFKAANINHPLFLRI